MKIKSLFMMLGICAAVVGCSEEGTRTGAGMGDGLEVKEERKSVTVAVMSSNRFLEAAERQFEAEHPEVDIVIKEYMALPKVGEGQAQIAPSQADLEKYIQTMTTQAIAGEGMDVISLNALPVEQYIEKNVLVDLQAWMDKDSSFDSSVYYERIFESMKTGDELYQLPLGFYLEGIISANSDLLREANLTIDDRTWTWEQFKDLSKRLQEKVGSDVMAFANMLPFQLLYETIEANYGDLVQGKKAYFDSDLFRDMMRHIKSMYDEGVLSTEYTQDWSKTLFTSYALASPQSAVMEMAKPNVQFLLKPTIKGNSEGASYSADSTFGINRGSKVQPEAWEFLKFLLSEEMQSSPELHTYPVHKKAVDHKLTDALASLEKGDVPGGVPNPEVFEKRKQMLKSFLEQAGSSNRGDIKIISIIEEEFAAYISGQKSAEEVSELIQNRVTTYLNE